MKEIWVLTIRKSFVNKRNQMEPWQFTVHAYEKFEQAKKVLREKLKEFAFTKNGCFDGNGHITNFHKYIESSLAEDEFYEVLLEDLTKEKLELIEDSLISIFKGEDSKCLIEEVNCCSDNMIAYDFKNGEFVLNGDAEGPMNGYNPLIETNMFDMTTPNNYYLHINDMFGQDYSSELYIDLVKTPLEE